jgi:hypothetical protein
MVYEVLIHVVSAEDTRRLGMDGRPFFYPFHFNMGAQDADQAVAPASAPRDQGGDPVAKPPMNRASVRHSCSAEYWRPGHCSDKDDDGKDDGRGGVPSRSSVGASFSGYAGRMTSITQESGR